MTEPTDLPLGATIPAKYSNYFTVTASDMVRLTFAEAFGSPERSVFHTSIVLTQDNAETLARTILDILQRHRAQVATAMQAAKDGS